MTNSRAQLIHDLVMATTDGEVFSNLLRRTMYVLNWSSQDAGDFFHVARLTIDRWIEGQNLPYGEMRVNVYSALRKKLKEDASAF